MKLEKYSPVIKFAVWDKKENKVDYNGDCDYGFSLSDLAECDYWDDDNSMYQVLTGFDDDYKILPYTNCKDINKNKLYLFDVVKNNMNEIGLLIYQKDYRQYNIDYLKRTDNVLMYMPFRDIKRIGNIYELPELQKEFNIDV